MKKIILAIFLAFSITSLTAQIEHPVKWSFAIKKLANNQAEIFIRANIQRSWHLYGLHQREGGPVQTTVEFNPANTFKLIGDVTQPTPITVFEDAFKMDVNYFENSVTFHQKVMLTSKDAVVRGKVNFMVCNHQKCLPPDEVQFNITIK